MLTVHAGVSSKKHTQPKRPTKLYFKTKKRKKEQVVIHFAGGGGSCEGARMALGYSPQHAINHNARALGMHRINHPETEHHIEDVFDVDPKPIIRRGGKIGLGWFSPDCRHFSKAKGGQPVEKRIRGLVLVMLRWAKSKTRVMMMENVEEISTWGPLIQMWKKGQQGWYPDPQHSGRTWQAFIDCMTTGLAMDHPDMPEFLQVMAGMTFDQLRLKAGLAAASEEELMVELDRRSSVTRAEMHKGFGYVFESRILRACDYGSPTIRKRLFAVFRRDHKPIVWPKEVFFDPEVFFVPDGNPEGQHWRTAASCIDFSLPTPSIFLSPEEARKHKCKRPLVAATLARTARGVDRYVMKAARPFIVSLTHQGGDRVEDLDQPFATITGAHRGEKALVTVQAAHLTEHANGSSQRNMPADGPLRTQCAAVKGGHFALVATSMLKMRGDNTGDKTDAPLHTASAGGTHHALVACSLARQFGQSVGQPVDAPAPTVMADGQGKTSLVAVTIAQQNGGFNAVDARAADTPFSAITATGSQQALVAASMVVYYGTEADGQALDTPAPTSTTKHRLGVLQSTCVHPLTEEQLAGARRVAAFLREHGVKFDTEFAMVGDYVIIDIGLRMLTPRELFNAQGFPQSYIIDRALMADGRGGVEEVALTKEDQVRLCGNSVCPQVAAALIAANCPELMSRSKRRAMKRDPLAWLN